jgi:hypothetical protein
MAGDWIKLQKDTPDKPEVLAIEKPIDYLVEHPFRVEESIRHRRHSTNHVLS